MTAASPPLSPPEDAPAALTVTGLHGIPEITAGDDLAALLAAALDRSGLDLQQPLVLVVSSKIVSKARGLRVAGDKADAVAAQTRRIVAERRTDDGRTTRIVESIAGPVMAAAGVDASNTGGGPVLVLPADPDGEAAALRDGLTRTVGVVSALAVILSDTAGRPWRRGLTDFALGSSGLRACLDHRGSLDRDGRTMRVTTRAIADELAAAADLVKGKARAVPAAVVTGCPLSWFCDDADDADEAARSGGAARLVRTGARDWFALGHVEAVRAALGAPPGSERSHEVGVRDVADADGFAERFTRMLALALDDDDVTADVRVRDRAGEIVLGGDERRRGRLEGRLEVAAWAEDLVCDITGDGSLLVRPRLGSC